MFIRSPQDGKPRADTKRQWLASQRTFDPPINVFVRSFNLRNKKPTDETNLPGQLFHVSNTSHVTFNQTMSELSNPNYVRTVKSKLCQNCQIQTMSELSNPNYVRTVKSKLCQNCQIQTMSELSKPNYVRTVKTKLCQNCQIQTKEVKISKHGAQRPQKP